MAGRDPYSSRASLVAGGVTALLLAGIVIAFVVATMPRKPSDGCPFGDPVPLFQLQITEGTSAGLVVVVNATTHDMVPLSALAAVLSLNGTSVATLAPLADGASNGSLGFHDVIRPGYLSKGDRFTVSPLGSGRSDLDLPMPGCDGFVLGRATWAA